MWTALQHDGPSHQHDGLPLQHYLGVITSGCGHKHGLTSNTIGPNHLGVCYNVLP